MARRCRKISLCIAFEGPNLSWITVYENSSNDTFPLLSYCPSEHYHVCANREVYYGLGSKVWLLDPCYYGWMNRKHVAAMLNFSFVYEYKRRLARRKAIEK